ncbi:carbohydrate ABC transporter permease [Lapidilactobacillus bayanensis]|uniref:carbohydrate ABC transporter permease n=1 Tax=Lapidilactobacillus bayanensis TaxID=2485998 RepID=UPI000F76CAB8|nr:sugar ABC transporter permease [Lapidilactobacillus bayanensis]
MQQTVNFSKVSQKKVSRKRHSKLDKNYYGYFFIAPFFIVFLIFGLYPILYTLYLSFTSYDGFADPQIIGSVNYMRVFKDPQFYEALKNTLIMWVMGVIPQFIFAFALSAIFSYNRIKAKGALRALYYLPRLVTAVSISALFNQFLSYPSGLLNQFLLKTGLIHDSINFLSNPIFAQGSVGFIHWWMYYGNTMIMVMAGMTAISPSLYEAARIDGANSWNIFWKITMPLLRPITLYVFLTSMIGGLQSFDVQQILTGGSGAPQGKLLTVVMYLYNTAFQYNNYGYSAAISYYLFFFIVIISLVVFIGRFRGGKSKS